MCGIAGIISLPGAVDSSHIAGLMVNRLLARGPDGRGVTDLAVGSWAVGLAHTRLAIIDLSKNGSQPMYSRSRRTLVTYNGEIYNFAEIRKDLESRGRAFSSQTDTEIILEAYEQWGVEGFSRFRGMFAFSLLDIERRKMHLVRDHFGIKPLYLYRTERTCLFASEVRALLATGLTPARLDSAALASFLHYGSVQSPDTLVQGVKLLEPANILTVDLAGDLLRYDLATIPLDPGAPSKASGSDALEVAVASLRQSVRKHMVSDVPVGLFLSGGLDSTVLAALMKECLGDQLRTFTVTFPEADLSEGRDAAAVARFLDAQHQEVLLSEASLLEDIPAVIRAMDQPTVDGFNTFAISRRVKNMGVSVAVSGLGGDEVFGGYPSFRRALNLRALRRVPRILRRSAAAFGRHLFNGSVGTRKAWDLIESDLQPPTVCSISRELFSPREVGGLFPARRPFLQPGRQINGLADVINQVSVHELNGYMSNTLLRDTDCMSMAHGLEVRVPFVDVEVVATMLNMSGSTKMDGPGSKPFLRRISRKLLPQFHHSKPKVGFTLPFSRWMRTSLGSEIDRTLRQEAELRRLGLAAPAVLDVWDRFRTQPGAERWSRPWALYVLAKWSAINKLSA